MNILDSYLYSREIHVMKYGLYILRKYIAQDNDTKQCAFNKKLLNFLCELLDYPDKTVRVNSFIFKL